MADVGPQKQGALLASGYGAIAAGAIALGAVLYKLYKKMTEVSQAENDLQEIRKRGQEGIIDEKNKIDALIAVARDETQSLKDRHTAIDALNKIIPNYNAQLDDTTGKYKENKKALDDYLKSLTRKYEIEGAKDKLRDIGKQRVDLNLEKQRQERVVAMDEMEARTETVMPGQEGKVVQLGVNSLRASNRRALAKTKEDLAELDQREANILGIYGEDIKKEALNDAKKNRSRNSRRRTLHTRLLRRTRKRRLRMC